MPCSDAGTPDGGVYRKTHRGLDIAYGACAYETLDYYHPADARRPPLWVFIHGGYWQAADKDQHAQFTAGMVHSGYAVANLNYGLCPDVTLDDITRQIRNALLFLAAQADSFGFDPARIHLAGHSAGAHLASMAAADDAAPALRSVLLLSGLFDLAPLCFLPVARLLAIEDRDSVARLSPARLQPRRGVSVGLRSVDRKATSSNGRALRSRSAGGRMHRRSSAARIISPCSTAFDGGTLFDLARDIARG